MTPPPELGKSAMAWYLYWQRRESENFASVRPGVPASSRAKCLSTIRDSSPAAYNAIVAQLAGAPVLRQIRMPDTGETKTIEVPS
jgi:hypothetical protein